ncbi:methylated-DNA--[protein]-cysteine S-methyltransferase [Microbacterium sp. STN6]|uniref:methylated-DNA--[protein]-cysteine S-methyltransferase n=1 Tax=Microbacterium sp. STN6 TaxID=2995588 RepID=UPI002260E2E1|nr:methylated-DNA--[protein]-cysteine S-methyltransferase [Microbacterium sp. STN6]MCX7521419.1 methylated-DNA--[protein]-cysteine S-methyltransferase [Microbacterium sp. STN6]
MTTTLTTLTTRATRATETTLDLLRAETPGGVFTVLRTPEDGVVRAGGYGSPDTLVSRLDPGLRERGVRERTGADPLFDRFAAYADGELAALDDIPVHQPGGAFHQQVWAALRHVEPGVPVTYSELAARAGRPAAVRAAASACARNLVALIVPCHRIVRRDGTLGGYLFGLDTKQRLLDHEAPAAA